MEKEIKNLLAFHKDSGFEAGCDEAGRGCLAGPVFAAAVILNPKKPILGLRDSKKLSAKDRVELRSEIEQKAKSWHVASCSHQEIDIHNILKSSFMAMHKAIDGLSVKPKLLLIDGNRFIPYHNVKHLTIIKGDDIYQSIAAASILAKTYRDEYMQALAEIHPQYHWDTNKGYPTAEHIQCLKEYGPTEYHRKTFISHILAPSLFDLETYEG